jgi:hypothetical protein
MAWAGELSEEAQKLEPGVEKDVLLNKIGKTLSCGRG